MKPFCMSEWLVSCSDTQKDKSISIENPIMCTQYGSTWYSYTVLVVSLTTSARVTMGSLISYKKLLILCNTFGCQGFYTIPCCKRQLPDWHMVSYSKCSNHLWCMPELEKYLPESIQLDCYTVRHVILYETPQTAKKVCQDINLRWHETTNSMYHKDTVPTKTWQCGFCFVAEIICQTSSC